MFKAIANLAEKSHGARGSGPHRGIIDRIAAGKEPDVDTGMILLQ